MSIKDLNLAARFALELGALGALGYWGFQAGDSRLTRLGLGVGAPLLAAIAWGTVVAPKAPVQAAVGVRLGVEVAVFGSAVAALADSGYPRLAGAFAVAAVANRVLMFIWGQ